MRKLILFTLLFSPIFANAQAQGGVMDPIIGNGPRFFLCIIAGVVLAFAFQLLLTMLSVAAGVSATGDIQKKANKSSNDSSSSKSSDRGGMNTVQKISTGIGVWTMITATISLFFASLLAVKLSLIGANFIGVTLGLVIWASFFMVMTFIEINAASSLVGGLISTAKNGLNNIFSKSSENKEKAIAKSHAEQEAVAVRKQFENLFNTNDIDSKIESYIDKLQPQRIDIDHIKNELKSLLTDLQVREKAQLNDSETIKKLILEEADESALSQKDKEELKNHVQGIKDIGQKDISNEEKAKQGIEQLTPADREQINQYQDKIKEVLQNTNKEELQPEKLQQDLDYIFNNPKKAPDMIKSKASAIDRQTLLQIISAKEGVDKNQAEEYVRKVENTLQKIQSLTGSKSQEAEGKSADIKAQIQNIFSSKKGEAEYNYNKIKSDFTSLFRAAGDSSDIKYKLEHYNKEQMLTLITTRTSISREKAEPIVEKIIEARDTVIEKSTEIEMKVRRKVEEAKQAALEQAEETRAAAATAAWWLVATAVVSGIASALGGMIALDAWVL